MNARILAIAAVAFVAASCAGQSKKAAPPVPTKLPSVEVRNYQGQDLSSVNDFQENSIGGPQKVDREKYRLAIEGLVSNPLSLTYEQVIDRDTFSKIVTLDCVEGWSVKIHWEGVKVKDLLAQAGYDPSAASPSSWWPRTSGGTSGSSG